MKILFLTSTLPRFDADQQAPFVLQQAAAWKVKRPNDEVHILAPHDAVAARHEWLGDVEIHRFQYFIPESLQALAYPAILPNVKRNPLLALQIPPFMWAEYYFAKRIVREHGIELIYAHWVMPQGLVARWLLRATGVPYVIQNHSSDVSVFSKFGAPGKSVARKIIRDAAAMFCVNRRQKDDALNLFDGHDRSDIAKKITVLPMGVSLDVASLRSRAGSAYRYQLGTISRLSRKKGIDLFIAAAKRLSEPVAVGIAGDGEDRDVLKAMTESNAIDFPGFLFGADKLRFFEDTKFMVFPSVSAGDDVEGLPVALLEALCSGKVVIASRDTNVQMLPEWERIKDDIFFLADPRDLDSFAHTLQRMLQLTPAEIAARSKRLSAVMSRYLWDNLIGEFLASLGSPGQPLAKISD
jgi:glycosyltransferase involved in cell wall biosynthesis